MANERELLYLLKDGNIGAFEAILDAYERRVYTFLARMCGNREEAKDLTQETFLKLYKNRQRIDPESNFQSWLFTVAANTARDWFRKNKEILEPIDETLEAKLPETNERHSPYYQAEQRERERLVGEAIDKLRPAYRAIILLFYGQDLNYEEIAESLNLPAGTVKTHLHRAKKELYKILEKAYGQH